MEEVGSKDSQAKQMVTIPDTIKNSTDQFERISMICWSLWQNRNNIVWKQKGTEPVELVESASLSLNQWRIAQDKSFDNYLGFMTLADGNEQWKQPPEGTIKINTDAALFEESSSYAYSMIARDHTGALIEARVACKQGTMEPDMVEAIGIREALSWVKQKLWSGIALETDCLTVVQAIRCSSVNLSYLGRVITDCKKLLAGLQEHNVSLTFVKRSANKVAHNLARNSSSTAERSWSKGDALPQFFHVMFDELKF